MKTQTRLSNDRGAAMLVSVLMVLVFLLMLVPLLVKWNQQESKWSTKSQKGSRAFNLAQTALDQAVWKLKSSTDTFTSALAGTPPAGYNFDKTFQSEDGGLYRIQIVPTGAPFQVSITAEGRDKRTKETRAIRGLYTNISIPGPMLSKGNITLGDGVAVHWGPVMSQGQITISGDSISHYFPRKFARLDVVTNPLNGIYSGSSIPAPRDDGMLLPPDSRDSALAAPHDWTSRYNVPDLPRLDFDTMRFSAASLKTCPASIAAGSPGYSTLNFYSGTAQTNPELPNCAGWTSHYVDDQDGVSPWAGHMPFDPDFTALTPVPSPPVTMTPASPIVPSGGTPFGHSACNMGGPHDKHFSDSFHHPLSYRNLIWYWDDDLTLTGHSIVPSWKNRSAGNAGCHEMGLYGTVIAMKNLTLHGGDCLGGFQIALNPAIQQEYVEISSTTPNDTGAQNEYPGDVGLHVAAPTFRFGIDQNPSDSQASFSDVGIRGFVYVKGDLIIDANTTADILGAVWVDGNIILNSGSGVNIFYDPNLSVPVLDVVLRTDYWNEVPQNNAVATAGW